MPVTSSITGEAPEKAEEDERLVEGALVGIPRTGAERSKRSRAAAQHMVEDEEMW